MDFLESIVSAIEKKSKLQNGQIQVAWSYSSCYNTYMQHNVASSKGNRMSIRVDKTFEDLVTAVQTIAYGEGEHLNENMRTSIENIAISMYQLQENTNRIAGALEELVDSYNTVNRGVFQRHSIDNTVKKAKQRQYQQSK